MLPITCFCRFPEDKNVLEYRKVSSDDEVVRIGKKFILSIKSENKEASAGAFSRLNAASGLHLLSRSMNFASGNQLTSADSNINVGGEGPEDTGPIPTFSDEPDVERFVGGAAVTRINVLVRLDQSLDQLTAGHMAADNVKASIREGSDINAKNKFSKTAICVAAENGRLDAVTAMISAKADIEVKDQNDQTVLHLAAKAGNSELVTALVNSKACLEAKNQKEQMPFDLAEDEECRHALKKMGAGDWTALMMAAERGDYRVQQYFYLRDCILLCMLPSWTWGQGSKDEPRLVSNDSGYLYAFGSEEFVGWGVHTWEILINVSAPYKTWAGVARGLDSAGFQNLPPDSCVCELMIAICSEGSILVLPGDKIAGGDVSISFDSDSAKTSHTLLFKLDMQNRTLEMSIDGGPASVAYIHDDTCDRLRPFVCFDGPGNATLQAQVAKLPTAFQDDVRFYSSLNLKDSLWSWGSYNRDAISLVKKESLWALGGFSRGEIALHDIEIKRSESFLVACAVGTEEFAKGVHSWRILASGPSKISVGVVRGTLKSADLLCPPDQIKVDLIFVFSSDGKCYSKGTAKAFKGIVSKSGDWSGYQDITLKLDMHKHTLELFTKKHLACTVSELDDRGLRPYICIEGFGSATLESRESLVMNSNSSMVSFKDRAVGLDNAKWCDEQLNNALLKLPLAGDCVL
jgi:hypothetical protein